MGSAQVEWTKGLDMWPAIHHHMVMDRHEDPSDLGLSRLPGDDDLPAHRDAPTPPTSPASAAQRRAVIDGVCRGQGWRQSRREQLAQPCDCGAGAGSWCRKLGNPVVGHIHHRRGALDQSKHEVGARV